MTYNLYIVYPMLVMLKVVAVACLVSEQTFCSQVATVLQLPLDAPAMSKPGIYVLQGLGQEPLTEGLAELTTDRDRWMEVARIAFPMYQGQLNQVGSSHTQWPRVRRHEGNRIQVRPSAALWLHDGLRHARGTSRGLLAGRARRRDARLYRSSQATLRREHE